MENIFKVYKTISGKETNDKIIEALISFLTNKPQINTTLADFLHKALSNEEGIDKIAVIQLIGLIHQKNKEKKIIHKTNERKHFGIFYTDYSIAKQLTKDVLNLYPKGTNLENLTFLEPCSGIGIFVIAYLDCLLENNKLNNKEVQKIISNIYCADIDAQAINLLKIIIPLYVSSKYGYSVKINPDNFYSGDILFKHIGNNLHKVDPKMLFNQPAGFDIIITNPPYKLLKANSNKYDVKQVDGYVDEIKQLVDYIKKNEVYKYNEGTLNYYKIFVEEILENYSNNKSKIGLLIPQTLLNDAQSRQLRERIVNNFLLSIIYVIPERNDFFLDISQAFCFFGLDKSNKGSTIQINPKVKNREDFDKKAINIHLPDISKVSDSFSIIIEEFKGWEIISKIHKNAMLKNIPSLKNLRGELDLTLHKKFINKSNSKYLLLRGSDIKEFEYKKGADFVSEDFLLEINGKKDYVNMPRLVCQQISNIHSKKRLKFTKIPPSIILGNSCNFIAFEDNLFSDDSYSLNYLLGLLNSILLDWRFNLTSSNNHVSNYQLSELPIKLPNKIERKNIEKLVEKTLAQSSIDNLALLNIEVFKLYGLDNSEIEYILTRYPNTITDKIKLRLQLR